MQERCCFPNINSHPLSTTSLSRCLVRSTTLKCSYSSLHVLTAQLNLQLYISLLSTFAAMTLGRAWKGPVDEQGITFTPEEWQVMWEGTAVHRRFHIIRADQNSPTPERFESGRRRHSSSRSLGHLRSNTRMCRPRFRVGRSMSRSRRSGISSVP